MLKLKAQSSKLKAQKEIPLLLAECGTLLFVWNKFLLMFGDHHAQSLKLNAQSSKLNA